MTEQIPRVAPYVQLMYGYFTASLEDPRWPEELPREVAAAIPDLDGFVRALRDGLVVVSVAQDRAGALWYTASVRVSDGLQRIVRVAAANLGLDDEETLRQEAAWAHLQYLVDRPMPDDAREITDPPS